MTPEAADPAILERLKTILRRDLKLGNTAVIADDLPFFGGNIDMDSLDILLLVTSIEKEFGIKVPNEAVGREVFQNVGTVARFIERQRNSNGAAKASDYLSRLPHQPPFRFISRVVSVRPSESAEGIWSLAGDEPFFSGHFPAKPIVPGVLIVEALAQLSGFAGPQPEAMEKAQGKLAHVDVRFEKTVTPPVEIALKSQFVRAMASLQQFQVEASVNGTVIARGTLALHRPTAEEDGR